VNQSTAEATLIERVVIERIIPAPPHQVFQAWLDPELLTQWLAPGSLKVMHAEVDGRVGGRFRIWQGNGEESAGGFEAEIVELVPDERLVFNWGFVGPDRISIAAARLPAATVFDSLLTLTFDSAIGNDTRLTRLTLVHERLGALSEAMPEVAALVESGWSMVLAKLAVSVAEQP
jgi:uncharacterized protein YndB with AHSA1/START domain